MLLPLPRGWQARGLGPTRPATVFLSGIRSEERHSLSPEPPPPPRPSRPGARGSVAAPRKDRLLLWRWDASPGQAAHPPGTPGFGPLGACMRQTGDADTLKPRPPPLGTLAHSPLPGLGAHLPDGLLLGVKQQAALRGGHQQHFLAVVQLHDGGRLFQHQVGAAGALREAVPSPARRGARLDPASLRRAPVGQGPLKTHALTRIRLSVSPPPRTGWGSPRS